MTSCLGAQMCAHSGGGSKVHFLVPFICACHDGLPTASIYGQKIHTTLFVGTSIVHADECIFKVLVASDSLLEFWVLRLICGISASFS